MVTMGMFKMETKPPFWPYVLIIIGASLSLAASVYKAFTVDKTRPYETVCLKEETKMMDVKFEYVDELGTVYLSEVKKIPQTFCLESKKVRID